MSGPAYSGPLAEADAVLAQKGRTFHWARRLLSPVHAQRATRLYGFCRMLDDLADEATDPQDARNSLERVREAVRSQRSDAPALSDALQLFRECHIEAAVVEALLDGLCGDLGSVRESDMSSLLRYCYRVAGTVGLMMCRVLDVSEPAAFPHAIDLGIAMQLTNICRDVAEDAAAGRRYLPASLVGDLEPHLLLDPTEPMRAMLRQALRTLLGRADGYYRSGELGLPFLPVSARGAIVVAARVYRAIGDRLKSNNYAYWEGRARVGPALKVRLTVKALLRALEPALWRRPPGHQDALHEALQGLPYVSRASERG